MRFTLYEGVGLGLITSTLSGTVLIGLLGIVLAHRVHTPPIVFTMPACITMIPGMYAYKTMLGFHSIDRRKRISQKSSRFRQYFSQFGSYRFFIVLFGSRNFHRCIAFQTVECENVEICPQKKNRKH